MSERPELWIPGPTEVRPELLAILAEPMVGHRTPEVEDTIAALDPGLRLLFGAGDRHEVAVHSATATALMELGLRAVGPRVLCLVNGAFSKRFAEIARAVGKDVEVIEAPLGDPADLAGARARLAEGRPFDAVTVCASETSTGALTDPSHIAAALPPEVRRGARVLVDCVTLLAAGPIDVEANDLDFAFGGTQKALALPPGLGLFSISRDMLEAAPASGSYFLDARRIVETHRARKPPMTPTVPLLRALKAQLEAILDPNAQARLEGMEVAFDPALPAEVQGVSFRFTRHERMREMVRAFTAGREDVRVFGSGQHGTSPSVTALEVGEGRVEPLLAALADDGFQIGAGYGALKGTCVRIGHMGDHSARRLAVLLERLGKHLTAL